MFTHTDETDALIETKQEAISYCLIYNHVVFLQEAQ